MSEVCPDVGIEPTLQPVTEEHFQLTCRTTNREDGAHLDVVSQIFWSNDRQSAFFGKGFQPVRTYISLLHLGPELQKKRDGEEESLRTNSV